MGPVGTKWFPAVIVRRHADGRCDLEYRDGSGDSESAVLPKFIRMPRKQGHAMKKSEAHAITPTKAESYDRKGMPGGSLADLEVRSLEFGTKPRADLTSHSMRTRKNIMATASAEDDSRPCEDIVSTPVAISPNSSDEQGTEPSTPLTTEVAVIMPQEPVGARHTHTEALPMALESAESSRKVGSKNTRPTLSAYERERLRNIDENRKALEALGLAQEPIIPPRQVSHHRQYSHTETRRQHTTAVPARVQPARTRNAPERLAPIDYGEDIESVERQARTHRKRQRWRSDDEEGGEHSFPRTEIIVQESNWSLPVLASGRTHNSSCHLCTQCVASWRGSFSGPLGCSQCPLIWCSRCLTNMYEECYEDLQNGDNMLVHNLIEAANREAAFVCPMCNGTCPCLRRGAGNKMQKHKAAGWVAVTGRRDPSCSTPMVKWLKDDDVLAKLMEPYLQK
eukprot:scaffold303992_cov30-Tisochrysis_lutea.AAC.2